MPSDAEASTTAPNTEATTSEQDVSGGTPDIQNIFERKAPESSSVDNSKIDGTNGYLSTLDTEAKLEKFFNQDIETRDLLRERFPDEYPQEDFGEKEATDTELSFDEKLEEAIQKRDSEKKAEESKQESEKFLNSFFEKAGEEFTKTHSKDFIQSVKENFSKGDSPQDAIQKTIGKYAMEGKFVPQEALQEARKQGRISVGQELPTVNTAPSKQTVSKSVQAEISRGMETLPAHMRALMT